MIPSTHSVSTTPPVVIAPALSPAHWVVLDIETGHAPESAIQDALASWKAPKNWKTETVEAKRSVAAEGIREKIALLDAAPIICAGVRSSDQGAVMFNGMGDPGIVMLEGWSIETAADERGMLVALGRWLDCIAGPDTSLVGHNVRGFDLPKLRNAYVRHRLALPLCLKPRVFGDAQPVVDTMSLFKSFSSEHRDDFAVSLDVVCAAFGVPRPKQYMTGADAPRLHAEGRYAEVLTYCAIDIDATAEVYRLMMA